MTTSTIVGYARTSTLDQSARLEPSALATEIVENLEVALEQVRNVAEKLGETSE